MVSWGSLPPPKRNTLLSVSRPRELVNSSVQNKSYVESRESDTIERAYKEVSRIGRREKGGQIKRVARTGGLR